MVMLVYNKLQSICYFDNQFRTCTLSSILAQSIMGNFELKIKIGVCLNHSEYVSVTKELVTVTGNLYCHSSVFSQSDAF